MWQLIFAFCHRLIHQEEEEQKEQHAKRVPDGYGRSFGSWPWQKLDGVGTVDNRPSTDKDGGPKLL